MQKLSPILSCLYFAFVDVRGPVVTISDASITRNRALFSWSSNKPARFYCAIDNQNSWRYCGAGTIGSQPYYNLQDGQHTFYVRGEDARGNRGNPALRQFSVGKLKLREVRYLV